MISTITSTVTSTQMIVALSGSLGAIASLILIFLLSAKEVAEAGEGELSSKLSRNLSVAIYPLLVTFCCIVIVRIAEVL